MSKLNNSSLQSLEGQRIHLEKELAFGASFVCEALGHINSRGLWLGDDPLSFSVPLLLLQLSLISIFTRSIYIFLKPFGQPSIVSQILVSFSIYICKFFLSLCSYFLDVYLISVL